MSSGNAVGWWLTQSTIRPWLSHTARILIPGALPSIMTGLRNGLSNAFRALIALEMVIGAAVGTGGLGWFVMAQKQNLEIPSVFAGIVAIIVSVLWRFRLCLRIAAVFFLLAALLFSMDRDEALRPFTFGCSIAGMIALISSFVLPRRSLRTPQ